MNTIFSSYALFKILGNLEIMDAERLYEFEFINNSMIVNGIKVADVERSTMEFFEFKTTGKHLQNLKNVLGQISDQPITVRFPQGSSWIEIKHMEC